ncbi:hypothetical protein AB0X79_08040 [Pediococcus pentosaceus]|uniref:hypothetical protein n=1 Tax=Pediococcus pentosaceus TaxID=1255 RepID=UPI003F22F7AB
MSSIGQGSISIDDSARIGENAQDTANKVAGNVSDINSDNKLTPTEKLKLKQECDKDVELYNIDIEQLKSANLPTTELETAMGNLTAFVTPLFKEMNRTSTVDRGALDSVFTTFATADKNASQAFVNKVQQVADGAKKAGDDAKEAGEQAQAAGEAASQAASQAQVDATQAATIASQATSAANNAYNQAQLFSSQASSEIAVQSTATARAQSSADNAFSRAQTIGSQASSAMAVQSAATAKAQSSADNAYSQAQLVGSQATSAIAVQSAATAKAQSSADNALSSASSAVAKAESTASEFGKVSQKADSAFDNALSAQNDASSAVAQASSAAADSKDAKQIAGAVSQSYKTLTDGSTMTIAELQSGLAAKLTKTDLNGYATETWAQNQIKMTADGINGTISSIKSTVDGQTTDINELKADSSGFKTQFTTVNNTLGKQTTDIGSLQASSKELTSGFNTLTSDNTTNKNDISQLKQTATEVSSTLETVQTQVKDSAVGTNLITGTSDFTGWTLGGGTSVGSTDGLTYAHLYPNASAVAPDFTLAESTTYAVSFDALGQSAGTAQIYIGYSKGSDGNIIASDHVNATLNAIVDGHSGHSVRVSLTFTTPSSFTKTNFNIGCGHGYSTGGSVYIRHVKLEKGSVATDWCLNPADTATKSQITQLSGEISSKVDSGDFSSYKTQTANLIGSKVANSDFSSYRTQTDKLIGSKVDNGDFSAYQTQTADLIASKVATKDFSAYQATTAKAISSKVESSDFNTYKTQTASAISSKVESSDFQALKTQANNSAVGTNLLTNLSSNWTQGWTVSSVGIPPTFYSSNSRIRTLQTIPVSSNSPYTISISDTSFRFSWSELDSNGNKAYQAPWITSANYTFTTTSTTTQLYVVVAYKTDAVLDTSNLPKIKLEKGNKATDWSPAPEDLATQSQITQLSGEIEQKVDSGDFSSYKTQTDRLIGSKVDNGDFTTYKTQTAQLIESRVDNGTYQSDKTQTADMIDSKVSTTDFTTYQAQTDKLIGSKVANSDFSTYKTQTANLISSKVDNGTYQSDKTQTANLISQTVTDAVSNISVGGTNLIKNSSSDVVIDDTVNNQGWAHSAIYSALEAGQEYTFTSSVTVNTGKAENICVNLYNPTTKAITLASNCPVVNGKIEYTFTAVKDFPWLLIYAGTPGNTKGNKVTFNYYKLEKGNKATDWSPAPEDFATNTEFDQINNAIKLKADSSDVTSQINVAIQGVQNDVTNKVSGLNTQISQTSDAVKILASTAGSKNLVYNATLEQMTNGFPTGWTKIGNASNETGYVSGAPASSYQGRPSIGINTSKEMGWLMFAQSDPQPLPVDNSTDATNNVYSASMMVKVYGDGGAKPNGHVFVDLAFFDANKKRIESNVKGVWSQTATDSKEQWQLVKVENLAPVASAKYVAIQAYTYGVPTHAMINQPMVNIGATAQPFKPDMVNQSSITASINNINLKVSNADGTSSQININNDTILLDANKIVFSGKTSILDASIDTAKIANAAINTAQIADGAINNAKIANASINDAKISNLNGNKIIAGSIAANKIDVNDLIANGINTKTLTAINLNASTLTAPQLDLGFNGTFTEDFDYTQPTSMFLPKNNKGTLTFNHGVLQSKGNMQTYVNGTWGGMNDNLVFQAGIDNSQWTEVAPGYIKLDSFKQNDIDLAQRTYMDPTGYYYKSGNGIASYLGNVLQTSQVQTPSLIGKYIGPSAGENLLQIGNNGNHYGLQVGSYAGNEAVMSDFIYDFTSGASANVRITDHGHLARSTSASKYKYNIKNPELEKTLGDRLLNVHMATWNDKHAVNMYAEELSTGEEREKVSIDKYYGLIAEQLRDAGLDMFIDYGKNHEIEGIQYDRAWVPLLSVIRRLNDKVNEYELRLSKLEGTNK